VAFLLDCVEGAYSRAHTFKHTRSQAHTLMILEQSMSLQALNTFGLQARAQAYCRVENLEDIREALHLSRSYAQTLVLGGGSNILLTNDIAGLIVHVGLQGIRIVAENAATVDIEAAAGERWDDVVRYSIEQNWGGIENLSLIPGTVGAAPVQNIGAYGVELRDVLVSVQGVMRSTGESCSFTAAECSFGYRHSIFKTILRDKVVITSVVMRLVKHPTNNHLRTDYGAIRDELQRLFPNLAPSEHTIRHVSEAVRSIRRSKLPDPAQMGNAGSFFKNPEISAVHYEHIKTLYPTTPAYPLDSGLVKIPAGWLIEACGWKGKRVGNTGTHAAQALVLVNYGAATGKEIYDCALAIQASVKERFDIDLQAEVNIW
jgi:UDP-N-acetylmuramate dehydrogenase